MNQRLIKLSEEHYIVVDDSEIKLGDWFYYKQFGEDIAYQTNKDTNLANINNPDKYFRKITHSTKTLIYDNELGYTSIPNVSKITLSEVEEAIYGYSVDKMAYEHDVKTGLSSEFDYNIFELGFKAHKKIVKDKLFTVEDMRKAIRYGFDVGFCSNSSNKTKNNLQSEEQFIQSLLPKTEWEVEFIDGQLKLKS